MRPLVPRQNRTRWTAAGRHGRARRGILWANEYKWRKALYSNYRAFRPFHFMDSHGIVDQHHRLFIDPIECGFLCPYTHNQTLQLLSTKQNHRPISMLFDDQCDACFSREAITCLCFAINYGDYFEIQFPDEQQTLHALIITMDWGTSHQRGMNRRGKLRAVKIIPNRVNMAFKFVFQEKRLPLPFLHLRLVGKSCHWRALIHLVLAVITLFAESTYYANPIVPKAEGRKLHF